MEIFVFSFGAFALAMLGLAVGRFFGRPSLRGGCGTEIGRPEDVCGEFCCRTPDAIEPDFAVSLHSGESR